MEKMEITREQYNYLKSQLIKSVYSEAWLDANTIIIEKGKA
jgi:hypothetical protein